MKEEPGKTFAKEFEERTSTSAYLVGSLQESIGDCWEQLVEIYGPTVYRRCRNSGLGVEDAEDVTQEVFSSVARSVSAFRRKAGAQSFRKWLSVITTNKLRDYWRGHFDLKKAVGGTSWHQWMHAVEDQEESSSWEFRGNSLDDSRIDLVYQIRAECSHRDWSIFEKLILDEKSVEELSREFSVTPNVVYLVRSRLLRKLRDLQSVKSEPG